MGGLKHSSARLTIAIARSTPAQKPRGLANTKHQPTQILTHAHLENDKQSIKAILFVRTLL